MNEPESEKQIASLLKEFLSAAENQIPTEGQTAEYLQHGLRAEAAGRLSDAMFAFKEAALGFQALARIERESANRARRERRKYSYLNRIYKTWVEENPHGVQALPYSGGHFHAGAISRAVMEMRGEENYEPLFQYLEEVLSERGMEFFSPGGSVQRRVIELLWEAHECPAQGYCEYLNDLAVRIGLDTLAREVGRRCRGETSPQ